MSETGGRTPKPYPIVEIDGGWPHGREQMGSKPKLWFQRVEDEAPQLFKYPQAGTGQHWAEKIAAEIASCLGILHAAVDLAVVQGEPGSVTTSFAREGDLLLHGNEVLRRTMPYDPDKRFGQSAHTLKNILRALDIAFSSRVGAQIAKQQFAGYVVLDGLIGNTDRHHENWGLLVRRTPSGLSGMLAPTFDHASSLGRELADCKRRARLENGTVGQYAEKARGGIFWEDSGRYGPSPLELVRRGTQEYPDLFRPPLAWVREHHAEFEGIVRRVPDDWMSDTAKEFAIALLRYNANRLEPCRT